MRKLLLLLLFLIIFEIVIGWQNWTTSEESSYCSTINPEPPTLTLPRSRCDPGKRKGNFF